MLSAIAGLWTRATGEGFQFGNDLNTPPSSDVQVTLFVKSGKDNFKKIGESARFAGLTLN